MAFCTPPTDLIPGVYFVCILLTTTQAMLIQPAMILIFYSSVKKRDGKKVTRLILATARPSQHFNSLCSNYVRERLYSDDEDGNIR